jgi:hypothetical protein
MQRRIYILTSLKTKETKKEKSLVSCLSCGSNFRKTTGIAEIRKSPAVHFSELTREKANQLVLAT